MIIKGRDQRLYNVEGIPDLVGQVMNVLGAKRGSSVYVGHKKAEMEFVMKDDSVVSALAIRQTLGEARQVSD